MEIEKQVIKTYSRRQPVTRYESRALLVPTHVDLLNCRESRINEKTLVVDNFDDTFDRLATGVVIPSAEEDSLDKNENDDKRDSDVFGVFKMPLQAQKKTGKPKQKGKPKKKDLVSKATSVKRKKVDVASDDSDDQEENTKKNKKSKEKVKKVVKKKKDSLSPVKTLKNGEVFQSDTASDENVPDNIEIRKEQTESDDKFKKPQENSVVNQLKISDYFQASTPRVNRIQANIDMHNISPVVMDKNDEKKKDLSVQEIPVENGTSAIDNFVKPRESLKVQQLKSDLLTSTPRINKVRMPVNLQNLSPIISNKEKRISGESREQSPVVSENCAVESNFTKNIEVPSDQVEDQVEPVKSPTKHSVIQEDDVDDGCNKEDDDVEENGETLSNEKTNTSQPEQQDSVLPADVTNEKSNQNEKTNGNSSPVSVELESMVENQDDLLRPTENKDLHGNTQNFAPSPLLFDDSECIQSQVDKNDTVTENAKEDIVDINFSRNFVKESEENKKDSDNLEGANGESAADKNKSLDVSAVSSYYPDDWTNDYDSTYGYDQLKQNQEKDATVGAKLDENKDETLTSSSEKNDIPDAENVSEINDVSSINNTEIQSDDDQDKTENTICEEDNNATEDDQSELDEQEKSQEDVDDQDKTENTFCQEDNNATEDDQSELDQQENSQEDVDAPSISSDKDSQTLEDSNSELDKQEESQNDLTDASSISSEDNNDSTITEKTNVEASEVLIEDRQSSHANEDESQVFELDESVAKSGSQDSDDDSFDLPIRPSKRRKTETSEIMIFNRVEDDDGSEEQEEEALDENDETVVEDVTMPKDLDEEGDNIESTDDTSLVEPVHESIEIIEKLQGRECRVVIERINFEDYKSRISSQRKPVKRRSAKRVSRKSSESDSELIPKRNRSEKTEKSNSTRKTRRSVTEDKMRQLYVQYECKDVSIFAVRLEDQNIDLLQRRSLKRKSRENSLTEELELDSSLTNGGLSEFLAKFNDPMKVTARRKTHKKYDGHLAAINEDQANLISEDAVGRKTVTWGNDKRVTFNSEDDEDANRKSQPIFLKPGKSWARSLSIINHFHNGKNLDELAAGRENWRHSVQTVLNMQPEVSARSSTHEQSRRESRVSQSSSHRQSKSMRKSSNVTNSRFSMRIIPGGKRSTLTDDLPDSQRISYVSDRSRASRKTSLKIRRDTLIETEDDLIKSAKDIILKRCKQTSYEPFGVCFPDSYIDNCRKIGEGVYGEVFLYEDGSEKSVIKIIPIEGDQLVNCEPQKKFHEILSEIIIAEELHKLRFDGDFHTNGFVEVNRIKCVYGKYPDKLINLWYAYDEQKKSENDCPSMFEEDQLYIILELAHGGQDLEAYQFQNASESYSIFLQTALTLAVAEQSLEFEHRDLHWGNLLISKTEDKQSTYKMGSEEISLATKGVKVAVIDFTLSRMSYQGCKIFNDLAADPTLFEARGEYQFDIYRMMRDNVNDDWQQFNPFTNVLWMDYTLEKMINAVRYKRKTTKIHKSAIDNMNALRKEIMNYTSAFDFVTNCKKVQALFDSS